MCLELQKVFRYLSNYPEISARLRTRPVLIGVPHHCRQRTEIVGTRDGEMIKEQMWTMFLTSLKKKKREKRKKGIVWPRVTKRMKSGWKFSLNI